MTDAEKPMRSTSPELAATEHIFRTNGEKTSHSYELQLLQHLITEYPHLRVEVYERFLGTITNF